MTTEADLVLAVARRLRDADKPYESVHVKADLARMVIEVQKMYSEMLLERDMYRARVAMHEGPSAP